MVFELVAKHIALWKRSSVMCTEVLRGALPCMLPLVLKAVCPVNVVCGVRRVILSETGEDTSGWNAGRSAPSGAAGGYLTCAS